MNPWHIREAARHLDAGGVIAYPTETVYGLGCDPYNGAAVLHLLALKQRSPGQGLVLVASDFSQLEPLLLPANNAVRKRVTARQHKPVSWVMPCRDTVPSWLRGNHDSLAVRITRHPSAAALCDAFGGPLVSTSANLHGKRPATGTLGVRLQFGDSLDYILNGPPGTGTPSEIRDALSGKILRT